MQRQGINKHLYSNDALETIKRNVRIALEEDIGSGDVTASLFNINQMHDAKVICRENATLCGQQWYIETFHQLGNNIALNWNTNDGDQVEKYTEILV